VGRKWVDQPRKEKVLEEEEQAIIMSCNSSSIRLRLVFLPYRMNYRTKLDLMQEN
jgi:hypothetical protein